MTINYGKKVYERESLSKKDGWNKIFSRLRKSLKHDNIKPDDVLKLMITPEKDVVSLVYEVESK